MNKINKYTYELILQGFYGYGFEDLLSLETDSTYTAKDKKERAEFKENVKLYRENERGRVFRVIRRRTKNPNI